MRIKYLYFLPVVFIGCSVSNTTTKVKEFTKCYVKQIPAPFWVCYRSSFISVGKVHTDKFTRLKQEEAYSLGVSALAAKLQTKTKLLLQKLSLKNTDLISNIKDYVILNALQGESWYSKKEKMVYVQVKIDEKEFKNFLYEKLKAKTDKKAFERAFDETF
jgi:hypothetical protein